MTENIKLGFPAKIQRYNIPKNCCCEEFCDQKSTHIVRIKVNGIPLFITLCPEHAAQYEDRYLSTMEARQ